MLWSYDWLELGIPKTQFRGQSNTNLLHLRLKKHHEVSLILPCNYILLSSSTGCSTRLVLLEVYLSISCISRIMWLAAWLAPSKDCILCIQLSEQANNRYEVIQLQDMAPNWGQLQKTTRYEIHGQHRSASLATHLRYLPALSHKLDVKHTAEVRTGRKTEQMLKTYTSSAVYIRHSCPSWEQEGSDVCKLIFHKQGGCWSIDPKRGGAIMLVSKLSTLGLDMVSRFLHHRPQGLLNFSVVQKVHQHTRLAMWATASLPNKSLAFRGRPSSLVTPFALGAVQH